MKKINKKNFDLAQNFFSFHVVLGLRGKIVPPLIMAAGIHDTGGKFTTSVNDTVCKFATGVNDTGSKLPPVSTTGGKQWDQLSDCGQPKMNLKTFFFLYILTPQYPKVSKRNNENFSY